MSKADDNFNYKRLKPARRRLELTLDNVAMETGLSIGYLNRLEKGFVPRIKNTTKSKTLKAYIKKIETLAGIYYKQSKIPA